MSTEPLRYNDSELTALARSDEDAALRELGNGADPLHKNDFGMTALHFAAKSGFATLAAALINAGAPVDAPNNEGYSPVQFALRSTSPRRSEVLALLVAASSHSSAIVHNEFERSVADILRTSTTPQTDIDALSTHLGCTFIFREQYTDSVATFESAEFLIRHLVCDAAGQRSEELQDRIVENAIRRMSERGDVPGLHNLLGQYGYRGKPLLIGVVASRGYVVIENGSFEGSAEIDVYWLAQNKIVHVSADRLRPHFVPVREWLSRRFVHEAGINGEILYVLTKYLTRAVPRATDGYLTNTPLDARAMGQSRDSVCWHCKQYVSTSLHPLCPLCGWIRCPSGACSPSCDFSHGFSPAPAAHGNL